MTVVASNADIATLRRRTAEPAGGTYSDLDLAEVLQAHPLPDAAGVLPDGDGWDPTFDVWAAAADVWEEKAASLAGNFDFSADGASYERSQGYEQARKQALFCASRRAARSIVL